jgi:hypothetical protein
VTGGQLINLRFKVFFKAFFKAFFLAGAELDFSGQPGKIFAENAGTGTIKAG